MIIDGNKTETEAMAAFLRGDGKEGSRIQDEFVAEFADFIKMNDHCPCDAACKFHGRCAECVAIHRGHRHHLPYCLCGMVKEKLETVAEMASHP